MAPAISSALHELQQRTADATDCSIRDGAVVSPAVRSRLLPDKGSHASAGAHAHPTGKSRSSGTAPAVSYRRYRASPIRGEAPTFRRVRTLHTAYRVTDRAASLDFYCGLGYQEVGRIRRGDADGAQVPPRGDRHA
jgi:hypothetical protein